MGTEPSHHRPQSWEHLLEKDPHSGAGFRLGILAAVVVHAAIFAITWPTIAQSPPEEPEVIVRPYVLHDFRVRQPEPPPRPVKDRPKSDKNATVIIPGPPEEIVTEPIDRPRPLPPSSVEPVGGEPVITFPPAPPPPDPPTDPIRVHEPPEIVHKVEPRYTEPARLAGIEGVVILDLVIDESGTVRSIKVLRGLPLGLTRSAVDAVNEWRFSPSVYNNRPIAVRYILTVHFTLS